MTHKHDTYLLYENAATIKLKINFISTHRVNINNVHIKTEQKPTN